MFDHVPPASPISVFLPLLSRLSRLLSLPLQRCVYTMADSFTLPLRPILDERDRPDTLPAEIAQINNQWGSFRDVNEDVLRTKIAEEYKDDLDEDEGDQSASDLDSTERLEQ